jgi:hypothetical protein
MPCGVTGFTIAEHIVLRPEVHTPPDVWLSNWRTVTLSPPLPAAISKHGRRAELALILKQQQPRRKLL